MTPRSLTRMFHRFQRDEDGGTMIEAILWFPVFFSLFVLVLDASMIFLNQAQIKKIMQDGARQMAVGTYDKCDELTPVLQARIQTIAPGAVVFSCGEDKTVSTVVVTAPSSDLGITGTSGVLSGLVFSLRVVYNLEVG